MKSNWSCSPHNFANFRLLSLYSTPCSVFNWLSSACWHFDVCPGFDFYWIFAWVWDRVENFERKLSFYRQTLGSHSEFCLLVHFAANYLHVAEVGPNFHIPIPIPCRLILCICVVYQRIVSLALWTGEIDILHLDKLLQFVFFVDVEVFCLL